MSKKRLMHQKPSTLLPNVRVQHKAYRQQPLSGMVLAIDDPRVWRYTVKFPVKEPDREAVKAHVRACRKAGLLADKIPVLWDSGQLSWHKPALLKCAVSEPLEMKP